MSVFLLHVSSAVASLNAVEASEFQPREVASSSDVFTQCEALGIEHSTGICTAAPDKTSSSNVCF